MFTWCKCILNYLIFRESVYYIVPRWDNIQKLRLFLLTKVSSTKSSFSKSIIHHFLSFLGIEEWGPISKKEENKKWRRNGGYVLH